VTGRGSGKIFFLVCRTSDCDEELLLADERRWASLKNGELFPDIKAEVWARINDARPVFFLGAGLLVTIFGASTSGFKVNI
jgi:hypothetical protein